MWGAFGDAIWRVALTGLILGAGLPALFAIGVREMILAGPQDGGDPPRAALARRVVGVICFAVVVLAVVVGIFIIVAAGYGKTVSFHHVFPTIVDKD